LLPANQADDKIRGMEEETDPTGKIAVGRRIAAARKRKRLLQSDLARQLGVNTQRISSWETGEGLPNKPNGWRDLCDALGVSADHLLFGRTAGLSDEAILKGWEKVNEGHYEADLGELGKISVTYDHGAEYWTARAFGAAWPGHPTAAEAQAVAVRMAQERLELASYRLNALKPST
jgi:transcriptional regulator with XRE-family HTH domain